MARVRPSILRTYRLPLIGGQAVRIATADKQPVRVLVRALSNPIVVSLDPATLQQLPTGGGGDFYQIFAAPGNSNSDALVITPGQVLYAAALILPALASVAISDAFPIDLEGLGRGGRE